MWLAAYVVRFKLVKLWYFRDSLLIDLKVEKLDFHLGDFTGRNTKKRLFRDCQPTQS